MRTCKYKNCKRQIWADEAEYCICHDKRDDKDSELFQQILHEQIDTKDYNFKGYYFPENKEVSFRGIEFTRAVDFTEATFAGQAIFRGTHFNCSQFQMLTHIDFTAGGRATDRIIGKSAIFVDVNFWDAVFFNEAEFNGNVDFQSAEFHGPVLFQKTKFYNSASFCGAKFKTRFIDLENVIFYSDPQLRKADFTVTMDADVIFNVGVACKKSEIFEDAKHFLNKSGKIFKATKDYQKASDRLTMSIYKFILVLRHQTRGVRNLEFPLLVL